MLEERRHGLEVGARSKLGNDSAVARVEVDLGDHRLAERLEPAGRGLADDGHAGLVAGGLDP